MVKAKKLTQRKTRRTRSKCCVCGKFVNRIKALKSRKCMNSHGTNRCHVICQRCWFSKFARENENHACPGCVKGFPLVARSFVIANYKRGTPPGRVANDVIEID